MGLGLQTQTGWGDCNSWFGSIDGTTPSEVTMEIDWIAVWALDDSATTPPPPIPNPPPSTPTLTPVPTPVAVPPPSAASPSGEPVPTSNLPGWNLAFTDDFSGSDLTWPDWFRYGGNNGNGGWDASHATVSPVHAYRI